MFFNSEARRRNKFIAAAIENTRNTLLHDPYVHQLLGQGTAMFVDACDGLFVPNVRDGNITFPKRHLNQGGIPVLAYSRGEELSFSPDFVALYPFRRETIRRKLESWNPKQSLSETEALVQRNAQSQAVHLGRVPALIGTRVQAQVVSKSMTVAGPEMFKNGGKGRKWLFTRPLMLLNYVDGLPAAEPATMVHELTHTFQHEHDVLFSDNGKGPFSEKMRYRMELEAHAYGSAVVAARLMTGETTDNLSDCEAAQLTINMLRLETLQQQPRRDQYEPTGTLIKKLEEIGMDFSIY